MNKMIIANLVHRPIRSLISIIAIAVEVTLILVIVGILLGILNDSKERQGGIGADIMVRPPGSSFIFTGGGAPMSVKVGDVLKKRDHVVAVSPVITQLNTGGSVEILYGIDLPSFEAMGGPFTYLQGGPFQGPDDVIVDNLQADSKHLKLGQTMQILNHTFHLVGIVQNGKGARVFMPLNTVQELIGAPGKASVFYVKLDNPANAPAVVDDIKKIPGMEKYNVMSLKEWLSLMTPDNIPGFSTSVHVVIGVAICIGFIVIFQSMYTAVMERTREIGILKSMGASKTFVVSLILREALLLAVAGIVLGVALSFVTRAGILQRAPTLRVAFGSQWVINATIIALVGTVLGAIYPAYRAAQKDPIDALAYE